MAFCQLHVQKKKNFLNFAENISTSRFAVENEIKRILFLTKVQKMVHCT